MEYRGLFFCASHYLLIPDIIRKLVVDEQFHDNPDIVVDAPGVRAGRNTING